MHWVYSVYGLHLHTDLPIPGLAPSPYTPEIDILISLQSRPEELTADAEAELFYTSPYNDDHGEPTVTAWRLFNDSLFRLCFSDGTEFVITREGTQIWGSWSDGLTIEDVAVYLLGPVLGFVLRLRGMVCLHASAVSIGDRAIALSGPAGSGKSLTAAHFAKQGYSILSDDVTPILNLNGSFAIQPAYPHLRLWPAAVNILYGKPDALPRLVPGGSSWDKRYLDLTKKDYNFQQSPLPLAAIYLLSERIEDQAAPLVESVRAGEGLISLITNTYANHLLDSSMRAQEFEFLNRVISRIPLRRVTPHADPFYLSKLCDLILADLNYLIESDAIDATSGIATTNG